MISELCQWLTMNRAQLEVDPAAFSVNLSTGGLLDESFMGFVEKSLRDARMNPRLLGFEIRENQCRQYPEQARRFMQFCEKVGCHVVIDDFTFHSEVLPMLRQRSVRMLKIDASLTVCRAEGQGGTGSGGSHLAWLAGAGNAQRGQAHRVAHGAPVAVSHRRGLRAGLPAGRSAAHHGARVAAPDRAGAAPLLGARWRYGYQL